MLSQSEKWQRHLGRRGILGGILVFALALLWHFREVPMPIFILNSISGQYLIAQIDFEFPDEEATATLTQEAIRDIGPIYRINPSELGEVRLKFEHSLINGQEWRKQLEQSTFEELTRGAARLEKVLSKMRFTNLRTLQKVRELNDDASNLYVFVPKDSKKAVSLPPKFWEQIQEKVFIPSGYRTEASMYIINEFRKELFEFKEDFSRERGLQQQIRDTIPKQYTLIEAGTRIIAPEERIEPRHIAMMQAMQEALGKQRDLLGWGRIIGSLLFGCLVAAVATAFLQIRYRSIFFSFQKLFLLFSIALLTVILAKATEYIILHHAPAYSDLLRYPLFVPFAAILICILIDCELSLFVSAVLTIVLGVSLAVDEKHFLILNLLAALAAILWTRGLQRRRSVFSVCGKVWLLSAVVILLFSISRSYTWNWVLMQDLYNVFLFLLFTAVFVVGLLPGLEALFGVMTKMTLMEYMDPNHELLRRLSLEAPGTYQHSLVVGNLAESAARAINANGLFCRVAALYHDIGKLFNPHYFTENQHSGFNIHQLLTPSESAQVIIAHIAEGEALAKKKGLPLSFIDIIREHHGTTLVYCFYCKQLEQVDGDESKVDKMQFRYPGPKPYTRESAILMIADCVEAASRSMDEPTESAIIKMIDTIVAEKCVDGQLSECQLTFEELGLVKKAMVKALVISHHLRVKYPSKP
ncbi:MAG: HDIG domain-containing metalloprotein [Chlamydiota bacterium]